MQFRFLNKKLHSNSGVNKIMTLIYILLRHQVYFNFPSIGPLGALNYRKFYLYNFKTMFNLIVFKKYDDDTFSSSTMNIVFWILFTFFVCLYIVHTIYYFCYYCYYIQLLFLRYLVWVLPFLKTFI